MGAGPLRLFVEKQSILTNTLIQVSTIGSKTGGLVRMSTIKKILSIKNFGLFKDFEWNNSVKSSTGEVLSLTDINIFYGRNYSGKSTIAKLLRSFERHSLPSHYDNADFMVEFEDGTRATSASLNHHHFDVRVYTQDFIYDNLSFLMDTRDDAGEIVPFAIIGEENTRVTAEIKAIKDELGVEKEGMETGLYKKLRETREEYAAKEEEVREFEKRYNADLHKVALDKTSGIKYKSELYGDINYTVGKLEADLLEVVDKAYVKPTDDAIDAAKQIIKEKHLPIPDAISPHKFSRSELLTRTKELLGRDVVSAEKIGDLLKDAVLEAWVKKGVEYHEQHGHEKCLFCNQSMPSERWLDLQKHFDEESKKLLAEITSLVSKIEDEIERVKEIPELNKSQYYAVYESKIQELNESLVAAQNEYCNGLTIAIAELKARQLAISSIRIYDEPEDCTAKLEDILLKQRLLRDAASAYTTNLDKEKLKAQKLLRLNKVCEAESMYSFTTRKGKIDQLSQEMKSFDARVSEQSKIISDKLRKIDELLGSLRDEGKAARLINQYLSCHEINGLRLQVENLEMGDSPRTTFKIYRGNLPAYNLSEGERTIIAFCYFLARLKSDAEQPIVTIDDPISSLDENHIYYIYSLIRGVILKESLCSQLIVMTHNLDFLKYLKRLKTYGASRTCAWFIVVNIGGRAEIRLMPKHLKEFVTEFNYMFEKIYHCATTEQTDDDYAEKVYGFANSARKFLELYLYFRFPEGKADETLAKNTHMKEVFGEEVASFMIDRVLNEGSHLVGRLERAAVPVDQAEMKSVALMILKSVKCSDEAQYKALLRSIGKEQNDPIC